MACAAIAAHQRCCLPGSLKTTDEGLKKKARMACFRWQEPRMEKNLSPSAKGVLCSPILRIPRRPEATCIAGRRRYPEDTAVSSGYYRCPGDTRCPEDTGGILGMPSVSWGCHWYPEDTGVLISIKKTALFVLPLNTSLKSRAGARESPPHPPHPGRLSLSCAARPRAAHTTAASPPRALPRALLQEPREALGTAALRGL